MHARMHARTHARTHACMHTHTHTRAHAHANARSGKSLHEEKNSRTINPNSLDDTLEDVVELGLRGVLAQGEHHRDNRLHGDGAVVIGVEMVEGHHALR